MPYIYSIVLLVFLFLYSYLITLQLYKFSRLELSFQILPLNSISVENYDLKKLFQILRILLYKKLWFEALKLVESQKNIKIANRHHYFNVAGFIYQNMNNNDLAKLCYFRSLSEKMDCPVALSNLAKLQNR